MIPLQRGIKQQIEDIGFEEGIDFEFSPLKAKNKIGRGRPAKDYYLTVEAAKGNMLTAISAVGGIRFADLVRFQETPSE